MQQPIVVELALEEAAVLFAPPATPAMLSAAIAIAPLVAIRAAAMLPALALQAEVQLQALEPIVELVSVQIPAG